MKKGLFLLPLMAGFALAGCDISIGGYTLHLGGNNQTSNNNQQNNNNNNQSGGDTLTHTIADLGENVKLEFDGYKIATTVKNGGRYLLGTYRTKEGKMRFVNGDYHRDTKSYYPFYMSTTDNTTEGAAEIEVKFVDNESFTMQVFAEGEVWDQKYIGVYPASSSYGNSVMSIALLDSPTQTSYTDPKSSKTYTTLSAKFKMFNEYEGLPAYAPATLFKYDGVDEDAVAKFLGTGHISDTSLENGEDDYTSVDCKSYEVALDNASYDLAHFYEKK